MPFMGCSRLVIGEGSHGSNPQSCSVHPPDARYKGSSLDAVCPIFYICPTLFTKYPIFVLFLDKIS